MTSVSQPPYAGVRRDGFPWTWLEVLAALIFAAGVLSPFHPLARNRPASYRFEATVSSDTRGYIQLYYDIGHGLTEADSRLLNVTGDGVARPVALPLLPGRYGLLRFDPLNRPGTVTIADARITNDQGKVLLRFPPDRFVPTNQIRRLSVEGAVLRIEIPPGAFDPNTVIRQDEPFTLSATAPFEWYRTAAWFAALASSVLLGIILARRGAARWAALGAWARRRPAATLAVTALVAVLVNSFPVVFFGRSYMSPNHGLVLLYDTLPTLPGDTNTEQEDPKGSDVGAQMWWHLPVSNVEREAVLHDHELPLWDRYDLGGQPLLGQGQSMIGDPLHWATAILGGGNAGAWDLKYLVAKWLLGFGTGLVVLALTESLSIAILLGASSLFIGFFAYRLNHPAFVSLCYSPWILYAWIRVIRSADRAGTATWVAMLVAAEWCELNSGTVKEAYMLVLGLNLAGALLLVVEPGGWAAQGRKWAALLWGNLLFVLLSAPLWLTFLDTLRFSSTGYDVPSAIQLPLAQVLGLFEDLFYRQADLNEVHVDPSANFLVLVGLLWAILGLAGGRFVRPVAALALAALGPFLLVYGLVPKQVILAVPFLRNIAHVDSTFSCILIVLALPLAGLGLRGFFESARHPGWWSRSAAVVGGAAALALLYFCGSRPAFVSPFFAGYVPTLFAAVLLLHAVAPWLARPGRHRAAAVIATLLCLFAFHWRHGQYLRTAFDPYVVNPQARVDLKASSPAMQFLGSRGGPPFRAVGMGLNLFPGFSQEYLSEGIYGVEALRSRDYEDLLEHLGLVRAAATTSRDPDERSAARRVEYDFLNVGYLVDRPDRADSGVPDWKSQGEFDLSVYQSSTAWPRAFFAGGVERYREVADFAAIVGRGGGPVAALQESELAGLAEAATLPRGPGAIVPATGYRLTSNRTSFRVEAPGPGVAVLTETWFPGDFQVRVNGEPGSYFRVNHAFKGVYLPRAGSYLISFEYWPRHLTLALWLAGTAVLLGLASLAWARRVPALDR
jgi:hypothetical protein